jgi:crossover junction endodeoxyribonuclease RuvC
MKADPVRILGIDTSLRSTGVGVLVSDGLRHSVSSYGTIAAPKSWPLSRCLANLQTRIQELIESETPDQVAIEGIFFCKNVKTAVILGEARGTVIATCAAAGLDIVEYAPRRVKQCIVGRGAADKSQVAFMVKNLLGLEAVPQNDAADALAIAYCHAISLRGVSGSDGCKTL